MNVQDLRGRVALVTGAGGGIGRATARSLARRGADLILCDLDLEAVEATAAEARALGRNAAARRVDVADREAMRSLSEAVHRHYRAVDILVNNAGVGVSGGLLDTPLEDWDWVVSINLLGVIYGCHFFVPQMVVRGGGGHVVNIASVAGLAASSSLVAYSTTKFGVVGLSEGLRAELAPHGIGVSAICPGVIDTGIVAATRLRGRYAVPGGREAVAERYRRRGYSAERVAEAIVWAIETNRAVVPVTPEAWVMYYLKRLSPRLAELILGRMAAQFTPPSPTP